MLLTRTLLYFTRMYYFPNKSILAELASNPYLILRFVSYFIRLVALVRLTRNALVRFTRNAYGSTRRAYTKTHVGPGQRESSGPFFTEVMVRSGLYRLCVFACHAFTYIPRASPRTRVTPLGYGLYILTRFATFGRRRSQLIGALRSPGHQGLM